MSSTRRPACANVAASSPWVARNAGPAGGPAAAGRARRGAFAAILGALLLAACATPPPPRPTPAALSTPPVAPPPPSPPASAPGPQAPYGPAVAARFPDPATSYRTPGLAPGRVAFTSDAELQAQLRQLVREAQAQTGGPSARLIEAGRSQGGVAIEALLLGLPPEPPAAGARAEPRPVVMFVGQQHGDEPAGAEALLVVAQQLISGPLQPVLRQVDVLILPRANPDGALRNQRLSRSGIDLNRDHLLLRTPEARAVARLVRDHRPMVLADLHEYTAVGDWPERFGVVRKHDVLLQYAMTANAAEFVTRAAEEWFRKPLLAAFAREQLSVDWYHTSASDAPDKPVAMGSVRPDNARNTAGLRHAVGLLIESRGAGLGRVHLQRRVHAHVVAAASVLQSAAQRAADLQKLRRFVDSDVGSQACKGTVVIEAETTPSEYTLAALNPQTGADRSLAVNWQSALALRPVRSRARPCGYWLAADQIEPVLRLRELGLTVVQLAERVTLRGEQYKVQTAAWRDAPVRRAGADSGYATPVPVDLQPAVIEAEPGSYYVPLTQPFAHLAVAALEPDSPSSYLAHGLIERANAVARVGMMPPARALGLSPPAAGRPAPAP
jgi:hypothetical protein